MAAPNSDQLEALLKNARALKDKIIYGSGGQSRKAVEKLYGEQMALESEITALMSKVETETKGLPAKEIDAYQESLNHLSLANAKKVKNLQTRMQVLDLESLIWNVSSFVTKMSVMLVEAGSEGSDVIGADEHHDDLKLDSHLPGYIGQLSQNCIFGVADSWSSLETLNKCVQTHVQNAAAYHKFHHEVMESRKWMVYDLSDAIINFQRLQIDEPTTQSINYFLAEFEAIHKALTHWRCALVRLSNAAASLVPVDLRTRPLDTPLPVTALANYTAQNMLIREGEMLTLVEGGEVEHWRVCNGRGVEAQVPSALILIPPPHPQALNALDELKFILLTYWTKVLKLYGCCYIKLLLRLYKAQYAKNELLQLERLEDWDKENMLTYFVATEQVLKKFWSSSRMYQYWLERVGVLRVLLEDDADLHLSANQSTQDSPEFVCMINSTPFLSDVTNLYQELTVAWECFKTSMDLQHHPEMMLSLQHWSQLQYLPAQQVSTFWRKSLCVEEFDVAQEVQSLIEGDCVIDELSIKMVLQNVVIQQQQTASQNITTDRGAVLKRPKPHEATAQATTTATTGDASDGGGTEVGGLTVQTSTHTQEITSENVEERQTFTISSVVDPLTQLDVSLDEAICKGILIPEKGVYKNLSTGENIPIQQAMMQNLIKVSMTTKKATASSKSSIGLVTIKSLRKVDRPYKVTFVKDTKSNKSLALDEAIKEGLFDPRKGLVLDRASGKYISLKEAVGRGVVEVEYTQEESEPEEVVKRYAVRAVVDRQKKQTIILREAISQGIINKETGDYTDNVTGEKMNMGEAMARGFVKARQLGEEEEEEWRHLDTHNQILVDRTKSIRKKVVQPLAAINAFKIGSRK